LRNKRYKSGFESLDDVLATYCDRSRFAGWIAVHEAEKLQQENKRASVIAASARRVRSLEDGALVTTPSEQPISSPFNYRAAYQAKARMETDLLDSMQALEEENKQLKKSLQLHVSQEHNVSRLANENETLTQELQRINKKLEVEQQRKEKLQKKHSAKSKKIVRMTERVSEIENESQLPYDSLFVRT
jgi:hypothetical protein